MTTILLIEPHPLLRLGLSQLLRQLQMPGPIIEIEPSGAPLPNEAQLRNADLLIYGGSEPEPTGRHGLESWCARLAPHAVLVLSDSAPGELAPTDIPYTVRGWLAKSSCAEILGAAVRLVLAGGECFPAVVHGEAIRQGAFERGKSATTETRLPLVRACHADEAAGDIGIDIETPSLGAHRLKITERQYEVLVLLARGYPIKTVSRLLNISVATAKTHACTLYQRLHVRNKGEAVYEALRRGAKLNWPGPATPAPIPTRRELPVVTEVFRAA